MEADYIKVTMLYRPEPLTRTILSSTCNVLERRERESEREIIDRKYTYFSGLFHVKRLSYLKCLVLMWIVFREFDLDLHVFKCLKPPLLGKHCLQNHCHFLNYWVGVPPFRVPHLFCVLTLFFIFFGSITMLTVLYIRERDLDRGFSAFSKGFKVFFVMPMTVVELCFIMLLYHHSFAGIYSRYAAYRLERMYLWIAFGQAVLVDTVALVSMVLHLFSISYICEKTKMEKFVSVRDFNYTPCPHSASMQLMGGEPTSSFALNMHDQRTSHSIPQHQNHSPHSSQMQPSPNGHPTMPSVSGDSVSVGTGAIGYGRLRRALRDARSSPGMIHYSPTRAPSTVSEYSGLGYYERVPLTNQHTLTGPPVRSHFLPSHYRGNQTIEGPYLEVV